MNIYFRYICIVFCISALVATLLRAFDVNMPTGFVLTVISHMFVGVVSLLIPSLIRRFDGRKKLNPPGMFG